MSTEQLTIPQQFARFIGIGALVFSLLFVLTASLLVPPTEIVRDRLALKLIARDVIEQPFSAWAHDLITGYVPFFLSQARLVGAYALALPLAWLAAFLFDTKILRKEKRL